MVFVVASQISAPGHLIHRRSRSCEASLLFSLSRHRLHVDSDLSMRTRYVINDCVVVLCCTATDQEHPSVSHQVGPSNTGSITRPVEIGLPSCQLNRLQSVLNAATRLALWCARRPARKFDHVYCATCIGSEYLSRSRSGCQCLYTAVYRARRRPTWHMSCDVLTP